ncbi:hypothetical protein RJ490_004605, partial [Pluralibacter gergoviae]|nr:hypothetical protein [Pluralibacter gergoviae]ELD4273679.1 hypothetical protein [Pluralibacter gergoviae]ELD4279291.1 hypothetical protein [Pluralibacter gergoviae]ELD4318762.1 hypothetical protein [Pluralibacter gergoviae]ELD4343841.1 hypothetical protein [Pluralibacter gergoviae]
NALESTFFNTMAGGLMHAGGGIISDIVQQRRGNSTPDAGTPASLPVSEVNSDNIPVGITIPERGTSADLAEAISRDADSYAYSRAYDDVVPDYLAQQQELQAGKSDNIGKLRSELAANQHRAEHLDATLSEKVADYQSRRLKFNDARARAVRDIQAEKDALTTRNEEISRALEQNAVAEQAGARRAEIARGELPDELKATIAERAKQIHDGMKISPIAGSVRSAASTIRNADWSVNQQAYRAALAQMMDGRSPDVEPFYDLPTPALRERAIQRIQTPAREIDATARPMSESADRVYQETQKADHEVSRAAADLENEFNLSNALLDDMAVDNPELAGSLRENLNTIRSEASDTSMSRAFRAYAACMINRGI